MSDQRMRQGNLKRDMLPGLLDELGRTRRRKVLRARLGSAGAAAAMVVIAALVARVATTHGPAVGPVAIRPPALDGVTLIQIVRSDSAVLTRWAVTADPRALAEAIATRGSGRTTIEILDDAQLLDALASAGRPAGIVRSQGRVWLTQNVTDPLPDAPG